MSAWIPIVLLAVLLSLPLCAGDPRLVIESQTNQTFRLSLPNSAASMHTFVEFSTNGLWYPAYFTSSNSFSEPVYSVTNVGGMRLFRASQCLTIASEAKASWERLGLTNYVFDYRLECFCAVVSGTVTVLSNKVAKVENLKDRQDQPVTNPELLYGFTISDLFDRWIWSEPTGGMARELEFDERGIPTYISLDPLPGAVDDEVGYRISNFTPLN